MELPLEQTVGELLRAKGHKLAVAESCTGGRLADRITNVPGASQYFLGGVVAYSNAAKMQLLNVRHTTLENFGAVSPQAVVEMAKGVRTAFDADVAISISGIAGPDGGSEQKPVGLVWIGLSSLTGSWAFRSHFAGDRAAVKEKAAQEALELLANYLQGKLNG